VDLQNEFNIFDSLASQYFYFSLLGPFAKLTEASFGGQMVVWFITSFCSVAGQKTRVSSASPTNYQIIFFLSETINRVAQRRN
jgi:hypothetical protein